VEKENRLFSRWRAAVLGKYHRSKTDLAPSEWVQSHTRLRGSNFSFKHHEYQILPINDVSKDLCTLKPSQVGWTEIWIRATLFYLVNYQGFTTIFTQPSQKQVQQFAKARVNPIIRSCSDAIQLGAVGRALDAAELKQVGASFLYLKGTKGASEAISVPSDMNVYDERDFSVQLVINQYKSRLEHSQWGYERNVSTPTVPKYGVSELWERSDKKVRMCRCSACGDWQAISWPHSVWLRTEPGDIWRPAADDDVLYESRSRLLDGEYCDGRFQCIPCGAELDRSGENMEWVAERPGFNTFGAGVSGYSMSRMDVATKTALDIIKARFGELGGYKRLQDFHNFCLGKAYVDAADTVTDDMFEAVLDESLGQVSTGVATYIGIDVGKTCHAVVKTGVRSAHRHKKAFLRFERISEAALKARVRAMVKEFRPVAIVIDAEPYESTVNELIKQFPGIVFKARYGSRNYSLNETSGEVSTPRTACIDSVFEEIREGDCGIFAKGRPEDVCGDFAKDGFKQHLQNLAKIHEEDDETGDITYSYINTGPDHWAHAAAYAKVAEEVPRLKTKTNKPVRAALPGVSGARMQQ
jgi:hypothetical protein